MYKKSFGSLRALMALNQPRVEPSAVERDGHDALASAAVGPLKRTTAVTTNALALLLSTRPDLLTSHPRFALCRRAAGERRIVSMGASEQPEPSPTVELRHLEERSYESAAALAAAFGSAVLIPEVFPEDIEAISFQVTGSGERTHYSLGSTRHGGVPFAVMGRRPRQGRERPASAWLSGDWSDPVETPHGSLLIGMVGEPPTLQAFLYSEDLTLVFIGFHTEREISAAVESLRRVTASDSDG